MASKNSNKSVLNSKLSSQILNQLPTPVMAVDKDLQLIFLNQAGLKLVKKDWKDIKGTYCFDLFNSKHCNTNECRMKRVMAGEEPCTVRNEVTLNGRVIPIEYTADILRDDEGEIIGGLEYIIDVSETVRQEERLKEQGRTIMEISTPVIKLWDRILMLPVIGVVDSFRAQQMMDKMLNEIKRTGSKIIILDIQGVAAVDTAVANHLIKIAKATKLMGCTCILSGISPAVAQTLVQLGIDLGNINTNSDLQEALSESFTTLDYKVSAIIK